MFTVQYFTIPLIKRLKYFNLKVLVLILGVSNWDSFLKHTSFGVIIDSSSSKSEPSIYTTYIINQLDFDFSLEMRFDSDVILKIIALC